MDKKSLSWILGLGAMAQIAVAAPISISGNDVALKFNPERGEQRTLVMPDGKTVKYVAYEKIYYVTNVEDSTYQYLNFYVPESALTTDADVPIFFRLIQVDTWLPKRKSLPKPMRFVFQVREVGMQKSQISMGKQPSRVVLRLAWWI